MSENSSQRRGYHFRGSIFWPIILITIGVVFLLNNINILPGSAWDLLLQLWPILLIAGGLDGLLRREGVVGQVFWIVMGVIFLLTNFGLFVWNVWDVILHMWPVMIVALGLDVLIGRRPTWWAALIGLAALAVVIAGGFWFMRSDFLASKQISSQEIDQPIQNAQSVNVVLKPAVAALNVQSFNGNQVLIQGTIRHAQGEQFLSNYQVSGSEGTYTLESKGNFVAYPPVSSSRWSWDLKINSQVPIDLQTALAVGDVSLDLRGLKVTSLDSSMAVGRITIYLPSGTSFTGKISGAVGETVIILPKDVGLHVRADTALAVFNGPADFNNLGHDHTSPNYNSAANKVDLTIGQAIGIVTVKYSGE